MDYEKKYKEALEKAKSFNKRWQCVEATDSELALKELKEIFPELRGDEDEKIRKALVRFHKSTIDIDGIKGADILAWLEKQGEQKPVLDFKASNWYVSKVDGKIHDMTYNSTNKVEPKFKVGDYIVNDYCMGRVVELTNDAYLLDTEQGIPFSCEHNVHLWTIQDAKKGDVLHSIGFHNDCIFIFNGLDNDGYREVATGYCCLFVSADKMEFGIQGPDGIEIDTVKPATQIQRDLLFQKMKEAGYEWDAEKKELKKIEDGIEIPFGAKDSELQEATYYIPKGFHAEIDDDKVVIKKGEKSAGWSKDDEIGFNDTLWAIQQARTIAKDENDMGNLWYAEDWLKSLKYRIGWKPSEKQMNALLGIMVELGFNYIDYNTLESLYNDLKKL